MELSFETAQSLDKILSCGDEVAFAAIKYLMLKYARRSVDNATKLLNTTSEITSVILSLSNAESRKYAAAADMLIFQNSCKDTLEKDKGTAFASMVPVCVAMFPDGYPKNGSGADKKYFEKFLKLFRDKRCFDWEKCRKWAKSFGYEAYLEMVERQLAGND